MERVRCYKKGPKPHIPGCTLGRMRSRDCTGRHCDGCGWNVDELARRRKLLKKIGLKTDPVTGLRRFYVPPRKW